MLIKKKYFLFIPLIHLCIFSSLTYFLLLEPKTISISIDKIYLLNLDRSKDRLNKMEYTLNKLDLPVKYTRFPAIDGNDIELINRQTNERIKGSQFTSNSKRLKGEFDIICSPNWPGGLEPIKLNRIKFYPRAKGEIAVACSHRKIWQDIVDHGYQHAMILEDDVIFADGFAQYLTKALHQVPEDADLLYLGIIDKPESYDHFKHLKFLNKIITKMTKDPNPYFKKVKRNIASAWGYIVSNKGAKKLLEKTTKHQYIDIVMSDLIERDKITAYVITPIQITTNDASSEIGEHQNHHSYDYLELEEF